MSDYDLPFLLNRVILIIKNPCHGMREDRKPFFERHAVPGKVRPCLLAVPLESKTHREQNIPIMLQLTRLKLVRRR